MGRSSSWFFLGDTVEYPTASVYFIVAILSQASLLTKQSPLRLIYMGLQSLRVADQENRTGRADGEDGESNQAWRKRPRPHRRRKPAALSSYGVLGQIKSRAFGALVYRSGRRTIPQNTNGDSWNSGFT